MNELQAMQLQRGGILLAQVSSSMPPPGAGASPSRRANTALHLAGIGALAEKLDRPFDEVARVYQCELVRLGAHAAVTDFLPVLAAKKVRQLYQHRADALHRQDPCAALAAPVCEPASEPCP